MKAGYFKRSVEILLAVMMIFVLSACGAPEEVKQEAEDRSAKYSQPFKDKVAEAYGEKAKLKDIECPVLGSVGSPVPEISYRASSTLKGTIVIDGEKYDAVYYPEEDRVCDTVHTRQICEEITDCLPLEKEDILKTKYTDSAFGTPHFESGVDSLDKALNSQLSGIWVSIITSQELGGLTQEQLEEIPVIQKIRESSNNIVVRIVSLKDDSRLSELYGKIHELHFSGTDYHPKVYNSATGEYDDAFEYYHIRSSIEFKFEANGDDGSVMRFYYNE
ncbi:MAG: hypothetical protein IJ129_04175 [Ruminococcus sp.]|nr:hypothetical protein [Ruminococcus sp.]